MTHTATPWHYISGAVYAQPEHADDRSKCAIAMRASTSPATAEHISPTEKDANMRRIVVCVNACDGIDTDVLAGWTAASGMSIKEQRDGLLVAVAQLRAERDVSIGVANELRRDLDGAVRELNRVRALLTEQGL